MIRAKALVVVLWLMAAAAFALGGMACGDDDDDNGGAPGGETDDDDDASPPDDDDDDNDNDNDDDNDDDDTTTPLGCIQGDFEPYWGVLHAHTSYSDGEETPADAFAWARDMAGLDIMVVTDHLEQLYLPFPTANKWEKCHEQADAAYNPGEYLTDCGYEYGSGFILPWFQSTGHNNVFFCPYLLPMIQLDFHNFYDSLVECAEAIGQFNHPGDDPTMTWNHWEYFPDVDQQMNLFEFNGDGDTWALLFDALDAGWHVSPMYNQDNHDADWGTKNDRRSGFFLADLTREDLHDAMTVRRSFMSMDKNAYLSMKTAEECWMGSILTGFTTLDLSVEAADLDDSDGFTAIELYGPGASLIGTLDCNETNLCAGVFSVDVSAPTYFVAKAIQSDGDYLVAAPIWVE